MRFRAIILLVLAVAMGAAAVYLFRNVLVAQLTAQRQGAPVEQVNAAVPETQVVVATTALRFGNRLGREHMKLVDWPSGSLPPGSFATIDELLAGEGRVVLQSIEPNEPILASKITGPGQRASLSAIIDDDMRAMTIRVNDVLGVAGFVLPSDRVDIMLTRELEKSNPITDVLLQNVKVLGIDQLADEARDQPVVVKAVTLEVTTEQAQKLTLAATVGSLSLALRGVANVDTEEVRRMSLGDLNIGEAIQPPAPEGTAVAESEPTKPPVVRTSPHHNDPFAMVGITRGTARQEYRVSPEGSAGGPPIPLLPSPAPSVSPPAQGAAPEEPLNGTPQALLPATPETDDAGSDQGLPL